MSKTAAATIKAMAAALKTIADYTAKVKPADLAKAMAMLSIINMTATAAIDGAKAATTEDAN